MGLEPCGVHNAKYNEHNFIYNQKVMPNRVSLRHKRMNCLHFSLVLVDGPIPRYLHSWMHVDRIVYSFVFTSCSVPYIFT